MSAHSVKLKFQSGAEIYVSPRKARLLLKDGKAVIATTRPFVLRIVSFVQVRIVPSVQRWSRTSGDGIVMSGALFEQHPPRAVKGEGYVVKC